MQNEQTQHATRIRCRATGLVFARARSQQSAVQVEGRLVLNPVVRYITRIVEKLAGEDEALPSRRHTGLGDDLRFDVANRAA